MTKEDDPNARIYPCRRCGILRSKNEGGTTFTVCDDCWGKTGPASRRSADETSTIDTKEQ